MPDAELGVVRGAVGSMALDGTEALLPPGLDALGEDWGGEGEGDGDGETSHTDGKQNSVQHGLFLFAVLAADLLCVYQSRCWAIE